MDFYRKKVFPALAGGLWLCFLFLDWTGTADSTWVKYAAICLCCVTALLGANTADGRVVAAALVFTLAADWFLLVRNDRYTLGICLFIIVQFLYAYRLYRLDGKTALMLRSRLAISCVLVILSPFPAWTAGVYFVNLSLNTEWAWRLKRKGPKTFSNTCFAWGLLLFICCDVCVGAFNLGLFTAFTWWGSWLFYLPSQVLIVLSQQEKAGDIP